MHSRYQVYVYINFEQRNITYCLISIILIFGNVFAMEGMDMPESTSTGGVKENPANDPNDICHKYTNCVNCTLAEEGISKRCL